MPGSQQQQELQVAGLYTNPSQFGTNVPEGALNIADDIVIDRESIAATRRGFLRYGTSLGMGNDVKEIMQYANNLIIHTSNGTLYYDSDSNGTWVPYPGVYSSPSQNSGSRIRSAESNKDFFFLTSNGCFVLDSLTSVPQKAGAPKGFGGVGQTTGSTGFMANSTNVAYRIVWGYTDANNNLILGAPSERIIVSNNSGNTANVTLTFQIPNQVTTTWFYQVYRSFESANLATPPNDELQQCFEGNPTTAQLTGELITITDNLPDDLLQTALYTNESQNPLGIDIANWQPPFANDIQVYKGFTFYANTRSLQSLNLTLVSSEPPLGLQVGDTVTFQSVGGPSFTLSGAAVENQTTGAFQIFNTGDPAIDIQNTAQSLVKICNLFTSNMFVDAYYMSDFEDLPGQMLFQEQTLTAAAFFVTTSRSTAWSFPIPATGNTNQTLSQNDISPNRVFYSNFDEPGAVPLISFIDVGSATQPISRILALRDGLIFLKKDGVYRLSGQTPGQFVVAPLDNTVQILADNSAVLLNNQVFFLSDQGIVAASDNGVQILSRPIETTILQLTSPDNFPNFADITFAVTYQSDRKYILGMQSTNTDVQATQEYVFNYITDGGRGDWTRWTRAMTCGLVNIADDKLYYGAASDPMFGGFVFVERKTYTNADYADEEFTATITGSSSFVVNLTDTSQILAGYTLFQSTDQQADVVTVVNSTTVIVDVVINWTMGPVTVFTPVTSVIETIQLDCKNPGIMKHIRSISYIFSDANFNNLNIVYTTDVSENDFVSVLNNKSSAIWGLFPWGGKPWGAVLGGKKRIPAKPPRSAQRCNWITINMTNSKAFTSFSFSGYSLVYTTMSERMGGR